MAHIAAVPDEGRILREFALASGQTPLEGAAVYLVSGEVTICGADPTTILGFMACDYGGLTQDIYSGHAMVYVAGPNSTFWMTASTAPTDDSYVGTEYGLAHEATTEITYVDITETTTVSTTVLDVDITRGLVLVSLLTAVRQVLD